MIINNLSNPAGHPEYEMVSGNVLQKIKKIPPHRELLARRTQKDQKGYVWTMGYNNCVGRYSQHQEYSLFTGSSLNRTLRDETPEEKLRRTTTALFATIRKVKEKMRSIPGWAVSPQLLAVIRGVDLASATEYKAWISGLLNRDDDEYLSYGVHLFSSRSRGKVKDKATAFFRSCPGSRVFVTLTFIAAISDGDAVGVLNKFLTYIRKKHSGFQFLWVAERQNENVEYPGNIHFHCIMNKRLPVAQYNALWVLQQYNSGLVGKNKYGETISRAEIERRYNDGTMQKVLNPFDVKRVKSIGGLSQYLTKYITKQEKTPFGCSVWHCSRGVSKLFVKAVVKLSAVRSCMTISNCRVDKKTGEVFMPEMIKDTFFMLVYINNKSHPLSFLKEMETINKWIISGMEPDRLRKCNDDLYRKYFICQN
jgi:hypothetical protein